MSTTLTEAPPLTVPEARRQLQNTRALSPERVAELERVVAAFHATRPRDHACAACGCMVWREHVAADGGAAWACAGCHRAASLTPEAWRAQVAAKREADAVRAATEAAAAPEPHTALAEALAARRDAAEALARLEQGLGAARTALASAQARHDSAVAAMAEAEQGAVARHVASLTGIKAEAAGVTQGAARGQLRTAEDALSAARGAKALLDDQADHARRNLANAHDAVHAAALRAIAAEEFEDTLAAAVTARHDYLTSIGDLAWLIRNRCVPNGDVRPNQLVAEASETPPGRWPEAADAGARMAQRLAVLEEGTP